MPDAPMLEPDPSDPRILIISPVGGPPPNHGNRARVAALLRELRQLGYVVHFAGIRIKAPEKTGTLPLVDEWVWDFKPYAQPPPTLRQPAHFFAHKVRRLLRRLQVLEDPLDRDFCPEWLEEARALQQRHHYRRVLVVYVYYSRFFLAFPDPCLKILETQDIFTHRRRQMAAKGIPEYVISYTRSDERRGLRRANRVLAIQEREGEFFRELLGPQADIRTVGYFAEARLLPASSPGILKTGCIGSNNPLNRHSQEWFFREVWPLVRQRLPQAEIDVAGALCASVPAGPGVNLLGHVPDLAGFYSACPVLVNPIQAGTGLKIKTIEALACGRPIVATRVGGEGLEEFRGHGLVIADTANEFAEAVVKLLENSAEARRLGETAYDLAQKYFARHRQAFAEVLRSNNVQPAAVA